MLQEYWVVGGSYCDANFAALSEGTAEIYGPFASYEEALHTWSARTETTRSEATTRYSVVVTAPRK